MEAAAFGMVEGVVAEIMQLHRSLPPWPPLEDMEAAEALARAANREERAHLDAIEGLRRSPVVLEELFYVTQDMHRALAGFQCREQKRDATRLLELDAMHTLFDDLIQHVSQCVPSTSTRAAHHHQRCQQLRRRLLVQLLITTSGASNSFLVTNGFNAERTVGTSMGRVSMDDSYVKKVKAAMWDGRVLVATSSGILFWKKYNIGGLFANMQAMWYAFWAPLSTWHRSTWVRPK